MPEISRASLKSSFFSEVMFPVRVSMVKLKSLSALAKPVSMPPPVGIPSALTITSVYDRLNDPEASDGMMMSQRIAQVVRSMEKSEVWSSVSDLTANSWLLLESRKALLGSMREVRLQTATKASVLSRHMRVEQSSHGPVGESSH